MLRTTLGYTARAAPLRALVTLAAAAAAPAVITEAKGWKSLPLALTMSTVITASACAYAAEDDAAETLDASPATLAFRRSLRLVIAVGVGCVGWAVAASVAFVTRDAPVVTAHRALVALASGAISLAAACALERRHRSRPGYPAVLATAVVLLGSTGLAVRYRWLPSVIDTTSLRPWAVIATVCLICAAVLSRDRASRSWVRR